MKMGRSRLDDVRWNGPDEMPRAISTVERLIASRYTGNAQTTSSARDSTPSIAPPKKPETIPIRSFRGST